VDREIGSALPYLAYQLLQTFGSELLSKELNLGIDPFIHLPLERCLDGPIDDGAEDHADPANRSA
jgi:hypothetical protein